MSRHLLALVALLALLAVACSGSADTETPPPWDEAAAIDAWAEEFCGALIAFSGDVRGLRLTDPIDYFQAIARIADTNASRIEAVPDLDATRVYQENAATGLRELNRTLTDSIPRIRSAIAAQDRAALDAEQQRITAVLNSIQTITGEGMKRLPSRAIAAMYAVPGCVRPNELIPADATGLSNRQQAISNRG